MRRPTPLALAALASVSVPGLNPTSVRHLDAPDASLTSAHVTDDLGRDWTITTTHDTAASMTLEQESRLTTHIGSWLPVQVPQVKTTTQHANLGFSQVYRCLPGYPLDPQLLTVEHPLTTHLGTVLAAIHDLPTRLVTDVDLPAYDAPTHRERRLAELDRAAATGQVPAVLLDRWETALDDVSAWRFVPCVVHGTLDDRALLTDDLQITSVRHWGETTVADPADDFAWLTNTLEAEAFNVLYAAYSNTRTQPPDKHLVHRARLAGELSLVAWLLHGVTTHNDAIQSDAIDMLHELADALTSAGAS